MSDSIIAGLYLVLPPRFSPLISHFCLTLLCSTLLGFWRMVWKAVPSSRLPHRCRLRRRHLNVDLTTALVIDVSRKGEQVTKTRTGLGVLFSFFSLSLSLFLFPSVVCCCRDVGDFQCFACTRRDWDWTPCWAGDGLFIKTDDVWTYFYSPRPRKSKGTSNDREKDQRDCRLSSLFFFLFFFFGEFLFDVCAYLQLVKPFGCLRSMVEGLSADG